MNTITSLPVIQEHNLLHSQETNQQGEHHNHPLNRHILQLHKTLRHKRQQEPHHGVQGPDGESLGAELHPGALVEEHKLGRIVAVQKKHWHLPDDVMHSSRNAEEVNENRTRQPHFRIMEQCLTRNKLLHEERNPNEERNDDQDQLVPG
ncbi:uncharacterized protein DS421_9g278680 [Arachis hypogaea]|nr:uncharacterized protein DS421_9g278680 [Arachis hypogaea]